MSKTISLFGNKTPSEQYSYYTIASALRGPDFVPASYGEDGESSLALTRLKKITTAVVRHLAGIQHSGSLLTDPQQARISWATTTPDIQKLMRELWQVHVHFRVHTYDAFTALEALG